MSANYCANVCVCVCLRASLRVEYCFTCIWWVFESCDLMIQQMMFNVAIGAFVIIVISPYRLSHRNTHTTLENKHTFIHSQRVKCNVQIVNQKVYKKVTLQHININIILTNINTFQEDWIIGCMRSLLLVWLECGRGRKRHRERTSNDGL